MLKKFTALFGSQDMTVGSPFKSLLRFSVPLLIGSIAQLLYTTADSIVVGQFVGENGLASVGACMPIQNLFLVFFMAIGGGITVMVSQFFGARDKENLGISIGNSMTLTLIFSILVTVIAIPLTGPILRVLGTNADLYDMSKTYLIILFLGSAANGFFNVITGILRGLGDSIFPLLVLLLTVLLNVALDIWFVAPLGLDLGIAGAAWATIIAQYISVVFCVVKLYRVRQDIAMTKKSFKLQRITVGQITRLGLPNGVQMAIMLLSNLIMQPFIMQMGTFVFTAMTATMRIDGFAVLPSQAFSMSASTFTGQNIGAGNMPRVKKGLTTVLVMCVAFSAFMLALVLIFGRGVFGLFLDPGSENFSRIVELGLGFIRIMIPAYLLMAVNMTFMGVMRGAGDSVGTMWISVMTNVILKVPLTLLIIGWTKSADWPNGHPNSIFSAMLVCMIVGCAVTLLYYRFANWRSKAVVKTTAVS